MPWSGRVAGWRSSPASACSARARRAAGSGWGSGAAQRSRSSFSDGASIVVSLAVVLGGQLGGDVPAAVVTRRGLVVAAVAVQRAAVEELLQAHADLVAE